MKSNESFFCISSTFTATYFVYFKSAKENKASCRLKKEKRKFSVLKIT